MALYASSQTISVQFKKNFNAIPPIYFPHSRKFLSSVDGGTHPEISHDRTVFLLIHEKHVVVPEVSHDWTIILEIHVDYVFAPEVSHDRAMFLVIHVHYFIVLEVSHHRTLILVIQVYYFVVAEVSRDRTMLLISQWILFVTWDEKKILVGKKIKMEFLTDFYYIGCGLSNCATKKFLFQKLTE